VSFWGIIIGKTGECRSKRLAGLAVERNWAEIVPRLAILGEWEGLGEVCWKLIVLLGLNLPFFMGSYALLQ
jgi:hypothetical protein